MQQKLLFLACFFIYSSILGQQYPFVYYTPNDGLINSRVRSIKQDGKGFMYFITLGGLSIYDGARFTNYSQQNGLAADLVNDVIEISPDSILIATNGATLNTLVRGSVGIFKTADNFCPVINRFFKSKDGNWYVAADQGLFLLSGNRFIHLPLLNEDGHEIGNDIDRITEWGNFFLLTSWNPALKEKLIIYDKIKRKVADIETKRAILSTTADSNRQIWITTDEGVSLIDTADLKKGKISFTSIPGNYQNIASLKNVFLVLDDNNNKWFCNREGIFRTTPQGDLRAVTSKQGLKTISITDFFIDREGIAWIASDGNGVVKMTNSGVELLNTLNEEPAVIGAISQQEDSTWIYNIANNSIYRICKNSITTFTLSEKELNIGNIYSDAEKLYLVNEKKIICITNKNRSSSYKNTETIFNQENYKLGNGIMDPYGNFIFESTKNDTSFCLFVIHDKNILMRYPTTGITDQLALDRSGRLWLITRDNQLMVFSLHPETPSSYLKLQKDYSRELPDLGPRSIMIDRNNDVWIGTRYHGIYYLHLKGMELDSIIHFTTKEGLTDNFIYTLACDSSGTIWAGTQTGLDKIFLRKGRYIIGNVSKNNNFFQAIRRIVITQENTVLALSSEGAILKISANTMKNSGSIPRLLFTHLKIADVPYYGQSNNFSFRQNNFSFSVAAPSYIDEKSIRYSYLLEGSGNNNWSEPSNQSTFNFINLSPANYTLKVKCDFPEAMYPSQQISYTFTILPPWWQTWWFRSGIGLLAIGILIMIVRFYYRRRLEKQLSLLEKQQAIEKERTRIATDMHDDLGAGLSRIKFLSETIGIKKQQQQPFEEDINKIREYSHEMIDKMGEIVWALNEKNDSLSDLLSYTRSYAVEYLSQNGISCTIDIQESPYEGFVSGEFRRNIFLAVKEILHNIIKHAQASRVSISIHRDRNLHITIHDNGIGFNPDNIRPFSNGIINIRKRMSDIGGSVEIKSSKGTIIILHAPLPV